MELFMALPGISGLVIQTESSGFHNSCDSAPSGSMILTSILLMLQEDKDLTHGTAGMAYLKKHPEIYKGWLERVTTADGSKPALPVFEEYLQKN